mgnify:CR=1 FL=1
MHLFDNDNSRRCLSSPSPSETAKDVGNAHCSISKWLTINWSLVVTTSWQNAPTRLPYPSRLPLVPVNSFGLRFLSHNFAFPFHFDLPPQCDFPPLRLHSFRPYLCVTAQCWLSAANLVASPAFLLRFFIYLAIYVANGVSSSSCVLHIIFASAQSRRTTHICRISLIYLHLAAGDHGLQYNFRRLPYTSQGPHPVQHASWRPEGRHFTRGTRPGQ